MIWSLRYESFHIIVSQTSPFHWDRTRVSYPWHMPVVAMKYVENGPVNLRCGYAVYTKDVFVVVVGNLN